MPDPIIAPIASIAGSIIGGSMQADAAESAAQTQAGSAESGIAEQRRQFEAVRQLLQPYIQVGTGAIGQRQPFQQAGAQAFQRQQAIAGLLGPEAQRQAIAGIEQSPFLQSQIQQGEEALLSRQSATGGLRGGNIQAALAQFRPQMLQQAIEKQYGRLGGFSDAGLKVSEQLYRGGQASAAGQASQAQTLGANVGNLLTQQGAAQAGGELAQARAFGAIPAGIGSALGTYRAFGGSFGSPKNNLQPYIDVYGAQNIYGPGGQGIVPASIKNPYDF